MISMYIWQEIWKLNMEGESIRGTARKLNVSKNTVRKYLRKKEPPKFSKGKVRPSQWESYKTKKIRQSKKLIASGIYKNLRKSGARGSRSSFYEYFKKLEAI